MTDDKRHELRNIACACALTELQLNAALDRRTKALNNYNNVIKTGTKAEVDLLRTFVAEVS